jgi:hypothetical protein
MQHYRKDFHNGRGYWEQRKFPLTWHSLPSAVTLNPYSDST